MTEAAVQAAPVQEKKYHLKEARFKRAENERTIWTATVEAGIPFEDVLKPEFWAHIASKMYNPPHRTGWGDRIEVYPDDMTYYAELFVHDAGPNWAKVSVLQKHDFGMAEREKE